MADVEYIFGAPIALNQMLPPTVGDVALVPSAIPATPGLYVIFNGNTNNRYLGVSENINHRFAGRQEVCFDLGLSQANLNNIVVFCGAMSYRNTGVIAWTQAPGYAADQLNVVIDGSDYDLEHMLIKAAQHAWPDDTVSNTLKVSPLHVTNQLSIRIAWNGGVKSQQVNIPGGGQLA